MQTKISKREINKLAKTLNVRVVKANISYNGYMLYKIVNQADRVMITNCNLESVLNMLKDGTVENHNLR